MTPAREAVRRLVAEGALTLSASGRVSTPELSNERIEELAALRALLETELATRALPRAHMALIDRLPGIWNDIAHFNPFFYMIDGFRAGFIGRSDAPLWLGMVVLFAMNVALWWLAHRLFEKGYKLKT